MTLLQRLWRAALNDWAAFTYCKWRGHEIDPVARTFAKTGGPDVFLEVECVRCGWPVDVYPDPDDSRYVCIREC